MWLARPKGVKIQPTRNQVLDQTKDVNGNQLTRMKSSLGHAATLEQELEKMLH